jgi:hypothetical protein
MLTVFQGDCVQGDEIYYLHIDLLVPNSLHLERDKTQFQSGNSKISSLDPEIYLTIHEFHIVQRRIYTKSPLLKS